MPKHEFLLAFILPQTAADPQSHLDALFEAGCDDASVGTGTTGRISLEFVRSAVSKEDALTGAVRDVQRAIPGAILLSPTL